MRKLILLFFLILVYSSSFSQINWTKHNGNPVLQPGSNVLENTAIGQATCLVENDTIKMWYAGVGGDLTGRIFYAWSTDGINWTKYNNANPVIDVGAPGEWDCGWMDTPEIVKNDTAYFLYYFGDTAWQDPAISSAIGLATSKDGITWTKHPNNPILTKGNYEDWDGTFVESPAVIYDSISDEYLMFYSGMDTLQWKAQIGLATSTDGVNWNKHISNPVIANGAFVSYDDVYAAVPAVLHRNNEFQMWYSAASSNSYNPAIENFDTLSICYASSNDGVSWTKHTANSLFNTFSAPYDSLIDSFGPWAPDVVLLNNEFFIFYETMAGICMAKSDLVEVEQITENYEDEIYIYPNPTDNVVNINYIIANYSYVHIELLNAEAKSILILDSAYKSSGNHQLSIALKNLTEGLYFIKFISDDKISFHPVILN